MERDLSVMAWSEVSRSRIIKFYVSAVAAGAIIALVIAAWDVNWVTSRGYANGLIAISAMALAAQLTAVGVNVGTVTMSIAFIPLLAAAFLFDPLWAMLLGGVTFLTAEGIVRKKPTIKVVFNSSKEVLAIAVAAYSYRYLGGVVPPSTLHLSWLPFLGAGLAYTATNSVAVALAVSISDGLHFGQTWARLYGSSVIYDLLSTPMPALLAYLYTRFELLGLVLLAVPIFLVRHIYVMNLKLEQGSRDLLELMVKNIEARDPYTSGHSQRVKEYARVLAKAAGLSFKHVEQISTAALLHDVGKTYSEYAGLLQKDGPLTPEEKKQLRSHPVRSAELVRTISSLRGPIEFAVRHHHENYDGSGYPDGLAGESIPVGARIIMIADTLDAMTTDRPYRGALPFDRVVDELVTYAGTQFDPWLVELAVKSPQIRQMATRGATRGTDAPARVGRERVRADRVVV